MPTPMTTMWGQQQPCSPCTVFKGDQGEDVRAFIRKVDMTCETAQVTDENKIRLMRLALQGKAGSWMSTLVETAEYDTAARDILATPDALKEELIRRWSQKKSPDALATLVKSLVMRKGESMEDFWDRCFQASLEVNYRRTPAQKNSNLFRAVQCEFLQIHCVGGLPTSLKNALPALDEAITTAELKRELLRAYEKVRRDGIAIGGAAAPATAAAGASKIKVEVAELSLGISDQVAGLTKTFMKWATNLEKKNALDSNAVFHIGQAASGKAPTAEVSAVSSGGGGGPPQRGGGAARGRGRGRGRGGASTGQSPNMPSGGCHRCSQTGHWARDCPVPIQDILASRARGGAPAQPAFGVNAMSYANAAQQPVQQPVCYAQPQSQPQFHQPQQQVQQGQSGQGSILASKWDF
jgi:hypothetical protein